jgi:hypothetical protein
MKKKKKTSFVDEVGEITEGMEEINVRTIESKFKMEVDGTFDFSGVGKPLTYIGEMKYCKCWKCRTNLSIYNDGKMEGEIQTLIRKALGKDGKHAVLCQSCKKDVAVAFCERNFDKIRCTHWIRKNISNPL